MIEGFKIGDGTYAAIPFSNKLMIIWNGQQLEVVDSEEEARDFIQHHKKSNPKPRAPRKPRATQNSQKKAKPSSGQQGSQTTKPKSARKAPITTKSKSVTPKKPSTRKKKSP